MVKSIQQFRMRVAPSNQQLFIAKIMSTQQQDCVAVDKQMLLKHFSQQYFVLPYILYHWWVWQGVGSQVATHRQVVLRLVEEGLQVQVMEIHNSQNVATGFSLRQANQAAMKE
jgi:hypothetical protein